MRNVGKNTLESSRKNDGLEQQIDEAIAAFGALIFSFVGEGRKCTYGPEGVSDASHAY